MRKTFALKICAAVVLALMIFCVYKPGMSGALYYDDYTNLNQLSDVASSEDAREFVFGGHAGPLGRPLALATFLIHAGDWPENASDALLFNVLIHIGNALLLLLLGYQLLRLATKTEKNSAFYIAFCASLLWALLPIQVSTSLIAVQRMTGLSAFFGLVGLNLFTAAYFITPSRPILLVVGQLLALAIFTSLSMFCKESGALIPIFALLVDGVLLKGRRENSRVMLFRRGVLVLLLLALLFYLSPLFRNWFSYSGYRGFSVIERIQTQWVVLWQYMQLSWFPLPSAYSPFHDDIRIIHDSRLIFLAAGAWLATLLTSVLSYSKTRWPLFALLWFLIGHLLESTSISLELFFEHRNYLALYGFCLALSYAAFATTKAYRKLAISILAVYILIIGAACYATTTLWGQPKRAAIIWAVSNEQSSRSALHLASLPISEDPEVQQQWHYEILPFLDQTIDACSKCIDVQIQALLYSCNLHTDYDVQSRFESILINAVEGDSSIPVVDGLFPLSQLADQEKCGNITPQDVTTLIDTLIQNPSFNSQLYITRLYYLQAEQAYKRDDIEGANGSLLKAESKGANALPVLQFQVHLALAKSDYTSALAAIERRRRWVGRSSNITSDILNQLVFEIKSIQKGNESIE